MVTTLDEKQVVGRKDHTCDLCVRRIEKGEEHFTQRNVDGRDIWTWRAHLKCRAAYLPYLKSIDVEPHWVDGPIDDSEFRAFMDNNQSAGGEE